MTAAFDGRSTQALAAAFEASSGLAMASARGEAPASDWVGFAGGEPVAAASLGIERLGFREVTRVTPYAPA